MLNTGVGQEILPYRFENAPELETGLVQALDDIMAIPTEICLAIFLDFMSTLDRKKNLRMMRTLPFRHNDGHRWKDGET